MSLGLITEFIKQQHLEVWIINKPRFLINLESINFESHVELYDWIYLSQKDSRYTIQAANSADLPKIKVDDKAICVSVNFVPLDEFLYPTSSKEKNLRMCSTLELGNMPIVFRNDFIPYRSYSGTAQITKRKTDVEKKLEIVYKSPWLITKNTYDFSQEKQIEKHLKALTGFVVKDEESVFLCYNEEYGIVVISKTTGGFDVGDTIKFFVFEVNENGLKKRLALMPRKIDDIYPTSKNADGTVNIYHEIQIGNNPIHMGSYNIAGIGDVYDSHGLINRQFEDSLIKVQTKCVIELTGARFNIVAVEPKVASPFPSIPQTQPTTSAFVGQSRDYIYKPSTKYSANGDKPIVSEAIVVARDSKNSILVYTTDPVAFKSNTTKISTDDVDPLPEVGKCLDIYQVNIGGSARRRAYAVQKVAVKTKQYLTRFVKELLEVRVSATITSSDKLHNNFFGVISNDDNRLGLLDTDVYRRKIVNIWCTFNFHKSAWVLATHPEPVMEMKSPSLVSSPAVPPPVSAPKNVLRYIGAKYSSAAKDEGEVVDSTPVRPTADFEPVSAPKNVLRYIGAKYSSAVKEESEAAINSTPVRPTANSEPIRQTSSSQPPKRVATPSTSKSPLPPPSTNSRQWNKNSERQQRVQGNANLEQIGRAFDEYFPPGKGGRVSSMPASIFNQKSEVSKAATQPTPTFVESSPNVEIPTPENFVARYSMDGIVVSCSATGVYVYTSKSPDKEAFLSGDIMDIFLKNGDWINFEARWSHHRYIVVSYDKRPPLFPTTKVRNSVKIVVDAFVPSRFNATGELDSRVLSSAFIHHISDNKRLVAPEFRGKWLKVVALRCKSQGPSSTIEWNLEEILDVLPS